MDHLSVELLEPRAAVPERSHPTDAGYDVRAAWALDDTSGLTDEQRYRMAETMAGPQSVVVRPGQRSVIPLGFRAAVPPGYVADIRSRSGLAARSGIHVLNAPGTIDAGYRGEWKVIVHNTSDEPFTITGGDRIAQVVFLRHETPEIRVVSSLDGGDGRGAGGLGSTGV